MGNDHAWFINDSIEARKNLMNTIKKLIGWICICVATSSHAIEIEFDYTYDTNGFFTDETGAPIVHRRSVLEEAASFYNGFTDQLSAISPSENENWSVQMTHPSLVGGYLGSVTLDNLSLADDTIRIYVGASNSSPSVLGFANSGFNLTASGSDEFIDSVVSRGQDNTVGESASDFGVWGGMIWFNSAHDWYFDTDTTELSSTTPDFLTTATHEIGHILGFGTADSWLAQINENGEFIGDNSISVYGEAVPLDAFASHWAEGTVSTYNGFIQETMMDPSTPYGERQLPTVLDYAGFADIGWQVAAVPEPNAFAFLLAGLGILSLRSRRFS